MMMRHALFRARRVPSSPGGAVIISRQHPRFSSTTTTTKSTRSGPIGSPIGWGALGVVGVAGAGLAWYYNREKERRQSQATTAQTTYGKPDLGGPWTLVEAETGRGVTDASYRGAYTLLYFGFSRCPDVCPAELVKVGEALAILDREETAPRVVPLFVSLDPRRDSLAQLRHFAKDFDPRVKFLVGAPDQTTRAAKKYRVYSSIADGDAEEDDYLIDHSIVLYLTGPDGDFLDFFTQSTSARDVAAGIVKHHRARLASS